MARELWIVRNDMSRGLCQWEFEVFSSKAAAERHASWLLGPGYASHCWERVDSFMAYTARLLWPEALKLLPGELLRVQIASVDAYEMR